MTQPPKPPFRVDLDTWLIEEGRPGEADTHYRCGCGAVEHSKLFRDVRDRPERFSRPFVCLKCVSALEREEQVAHEEAVRLHNEAQGVLDEEVLNGLRAQRDLALVRSDWTQLADNRQRIGQEMSGTWDEYRAALRSWFSTARDTGQVGPLPAPPE